MKPKLNRPATLAAARGSAKPCDIPCPKCGGMDIYREHREVGESVDKLDLDDDCKTIPPYLKSDWPYGYKVTKEHIGHHCRVCQYAWRTDILPNDEVQRPRPTRFAATPGSAAAELPKPQ